MSYEEMPVGPGVDMGIPGWFIAFAVVAVVVGVVGTIWRVSLARQMATDAGLDPDRAAAMTLMSDEGLDATYLASSIRGAAVPSPAGETRSAQERLQELRQLHDEGLISYEEYERRRTAIVDSI